MSTAAVARRRREEAERREPKSAAQSPGGSTGEAWIRLIWSTNGGATGTPFFMPGAPWDTSPAASTAPFYLRATGATDPVAVAAPDNLFFVTFLAFKRGDVNYLSVARFRDDEVADSATRHSLVFEGFTTLASGNNATFGTLNDKPHSIIVPDVTATGGYALYVSYTLFNGNPGGGKFQSQLFVAKSTDRGRDLHHREDQRQHAGEHRHGADPAPRRQASPRSSAASATARRSTPRSRAAISAGPSRSRSSSPRIRRWPSTTRGVSSSIP